MASSTHQTVTLVLTGQRENGRHRIVINNTDVELTRGQLRLLVKLILALGQDGYLFDPKRPEWFRLSIHRLRRALDQAAPGLGNDLIRRGDVNEYRLNINVDSIEFADSFLQYSIPGISHDEITEIRAVIQHTTCK